MSSYIYKNENGVHNIYVEGYEEKPIRTLPSEELAIMWCKDMTISYDLGWDHGCQLGIEYEEDSVFIITVLNEYYPSVLHFKTYEDAKKRFHELQDEGYTLHLSEVQDTFHRNKYIDDDCEKYKIEDYNENPNIIDIEWYI